MMGLPSAGVIYFLQLALLLHVFKTGRDRSWIYILLFFPGLGAAIYIISEVLPDLGSSRGLGRSSRNILDFIMPDRDLKRLRQQVAFVDSPDNRFALGEEALRRGFLDEALSAYLACQRGQHGEDVHVLWGLARVYFEKKDYQAAKQTLLTILALQPTALRGKVDLLLAQTLAACGEGAAAAASYQHALINFVGEEALFRYGCFLRQQGQDEIAREQFAQVVLHVRQSPSYVRRAQRVWAKAAKLALREMKAA